MEHLAEMIAGLFQWVWDEVAAWLHRRRRKTEEDVTRCQSCQHSLEGSLAANLPRCPECGEKIPRWQRAEWRHLQRHAENKS
jgi:predicted RNA-binding Zn-ribbon protein involved in translation (DUF1610 family)